jgi:hypothetical protein
MTDRRIALWHDVPGRSSVETESVRWVEQRLPVLTPEEETMHHVDLVVALVGILVTVAAIVLGAWLDIRPRRNGDDRGRPPAPN